MHNNAVKCVVVSLVLLVDIVALHQRLMTSSETQWICRDNNCISDLANSAGELEWLTWAKFDCFVGSLRVGRALNWRLRVTDRANFANFDRPPLLSSLSMGCLSAVISRKVNKNNTTKSPSFRIGATWSRSHNGVSERKRWAYVNSIWLITLRHCCDMNAHQGCNIPFANSHLIQ